MLDHTCDGIASIIQVMVPFELDLGAIIPQGNGKVAPAHLCLEILLCPRTSTELWCDRFKLGKLPNSVECDLMVAASSRQAGAFAERTSRQTQGSQAAEGPSSVESS